MGSLTVKAGRLGLKVPKLKGAVFESAVIERYRRREESVEEALIDMYLAGVSTRRVDDISQLPWGARMPSQTLSDKPKRVYAEIDQWRMRPPEGEYPYVFVGGFPDGNSALMLVCARIRYVTANEWSVRRYLDMSRLDDNLVEAN